MSLHPELQIDDLSKEVTKLKEALNSLSQLSYSGSSTPKRQQSQQLEALQQQIKQLQYQLTVSPFNHEGLALPRCVSVCLCVSVSVCPCVGVCVCTCAQAGSSEGSMDHYSRVLCEKYLGIPSHTT